MGRTSTTSNAGHSQKRIGVNKANARILAITGGAAFLVIFCLVGAYSLLGQLTYQNRIISEKKKAVTQLQANMKARDQLVKSFNSFASSETNFLGGSADGIGPKDGNNAKLVLDALPSKYDFPAMASSLEKIANDRRVSIDSISGIDDEVAQAAASKKDGNPAPVEIPFEMKINGDYTGARLFVDALDRSIRPIQIRSMQLTGSSGQVTVGVTASTYYQPAKKLTLNYKVVQ